MITGYVIMDEGGTPLIKDQLLPIEEGRGEFLTPLLSVLNQLSGKVINGDIKFIETSGQQIYMERNEHKSVVITSDVKNEELRSIARDLLNLVEGGEFRIEELEYDLEMKRKAKQQCRQIISEKFPKMRALTEYEGERIPKSECRALEKIKSGMEGKPEIEVEDQSVTTLNLENTALSDLSPLQYFLNLIRLNLHGTPVSDISPLKSLVNLKELDLGNTEVTDVKPLRYLKNLEVLRLGNTNLSDITPLKALENLKELKLSMAKVSDLSPLLELENLRRVILWYTTFSQSDEQIEKLMERGVEVKL